MYSEFTGHSGRCYHVEKELGEGGMAHAFMATTVGNSEERVVIKTPNIQFDFPLEDIEDRLTEVYVTFRREFRYTNERLKKVHCVAHVSDHGASELTSPDGQKFISFFIVQEYVDGEPLERYLKRKYPSRRNKKGEFNGMPSYIEWHTLAERLTKTLDEVHKERVVHSDIWPPNFMVRREDEQPILIDFGQAWDVDRSLSQPGGNEKQHAYMAPERREANRRWETSADIYSLGGVLYYLATGQPPPEPNGDNDTLKDTLELKIHELNQRLYKSNPGLVDVIHRCLRCNVHERAPHAGAILQDLRIFAPEGKRHRVSSVTDLCGTLQEALQALESPRNEPINPLFLEMAYREIETLSRRMKNIHGRLYDLSGDRETMLNGMLECFRSLERGDQYIELSIPSLWYSTQLGVRGRFLTMNRIAAERGVRIRRLLLVTGNELENQGVVRVLMAQKQMQEAISKSTSRNTRKARTAATDKTLHGDGYYTGYLAVLPDELDDVIRRGYHGALVCKGGIYTLAAFDYQQDGDRARLTNVRLWAQPTQLEERLKYLGRNLEKSNPISEYVPPPDLQ